MSTWKYEFKNFELILSIIEAAGWKCQEPGNHEDDWMLSEVDAEVHRLNLLIEKSQSDIYKLRKWQRALQTKGETK